ncbi:MAG: NifB/NifX family molybdenum-iron cluster-binding protein [Anaerolineae bacterium]
MKIAFVAENEQTISAHFGRAPYVVVVTVEDGREVGRELRRKEAHGAHDHAHEQTHEHDHGHHHQHDHTGKFAAMQDCDVMIVRGIGSPAIAHAQNMGLQVVLTRESGIDAALAAFLAGELDHDPRRIHHH